MKLGKLLKSSSKIFHCNLIFLADGTVLKREDGDSINTDDIPDLTPGSTTSGCSSSDSTGTIWGFAGGLEDVRVVERTGVRE